MPRWWHEGADWLEALPGTAEAVCERWRLNPEGAAMHGSNAIVLPVRRDGVPLALRMTMPDKRKADEVRALRFWNGRGTVRLLEADAGMGASLLERLDGQRSLAQLPLEDAVPVIAKLMRRLAVPAPPDVTSTASIVQGQIDTMPAEWERLGRPFNRSVLDDALSAAIPLRETSSNLAVNGDLHFEQVLAGERESWLAVDPVLLRGDIEYDLARILWSRLDEMARNEDIRHWFNVIITAAGLERDRARAWVIFRAVDYWLWGLDYGLTEDPKRCERLVGVFGADQPRG